MRDEISRLYNENNVLPEKGRLCNADLQLIRDWKWDKNITEVYDEFLTISVRPFLSFPSLTIKMMEICKGWNEMRDLAMVYKAAFPDVIGNSYSPEQFLFRHTDYQRTEGSYKAFAEGLFGEGAYNWFTIHPPVNPSMLLNV